MKILQILSMYHPEGENWLRDQAEIIRIDDYSEESILSTLTKHPDIEGIILRAPARITSCILTSTSSIRVISGAGVGVDNIDVSSATKKGIAVLHAPNVNAESTAEHAVALMFGLIKNLHMYHAEMKKGNYAVRTAILPHEMKGKRLGLIGWGGIARHVARICSLGLGMNVVSYVREIDELKTIQADKLGTTLTTDIAEIFRESDIISVHIPLNEHTRGLIDRDLFSLMKSSAYFINTARGGVIKEMDLYEALKQGRISGAGLDVFAEEPVPLHSPLLQLSNVILTPHVGGLSEEAARKMSTLVARNMVGCLHGEKPRYIVNPEVLNSVNA